MPEVPVPESRWAELAEEIDQFRADAGVTPLTEEEWAALVAPIEHAPWVPWWSEECCGYRPERCWCCGDQIGPLSTDGSCGSCYAEARCSNGEVARMAPALIGERFLSGFIAPDDLSYLRDD